MKFILDIDFGGTINNNEHVPNWTAENNSQQSLQHPDPDHMGHLEPTPFPICLDTLRRIKNSGLFEPIGVVSKIVMHPLVQRKVRQWFTHHRFDAVIPQELIRFCATYEEKVNFCRARGTTHFFDNYLGCMAPMAGIVPHLFLFTHPDAQKHVAGNDKLWHLVYEGKVIPVASWQEFGDLVLQTARK